MVYWAERWGIRGFIHGTLYWIGSEWSRGRMLYRLLNALPPNRYTAFALVAFVDIAGYRLHQVYRFVPCL